MTSAYIFLDVDGVLNPFSLPRGGGWKRDRPGWLNYNPKLGKKLLDLAAKYDAQIVWLTAWEGRANGSIGPMTGLPDDLPHVSLLWNDKRYYGSTFGQVKAASLRRWMRGKGDVPFIWFDDEWDVYSALVHAMKGKGKAIHIKDTRGITTADLERADDALAEQFHARNWQDPLPFGEAA